MNDIEILIQQYEAISGVNEYPLVCEIPIRDVVSDLTVSESDFTVQRNDLKPIRLSHYHEQDCCESVYADWPYTRPFIAQDFTPKYYETLRVFGVPDGGIVMRFFPPEAEGTPPISFFVPCYNSQNGYYSSALDLACDQDRFSVSDFVKDLIY